MSCANEAWSTTVVDSPSLCLDQHSTSVAAPRRRVKETKTDQNKINRCVIRRDHAHTNSEHVWGDEGPVNERRTIS